ncbi:MAG TPA: ATP-binding protein [Gemmatimonadales bacterium]
MAFLRRRLTIWYVGTLAATLLILGTGLFLAIKVEMDHRLRRTLRQRVAAVERAARSVDSTADAGASLVERAATLRFTDRNVFLFTASGDPITPRTVPPWVQVLAARADSTGAYLHTAGTDERGRVEPNLRVWEQRFRLDDSTVAVAVATSEAAELHDEDVDLIVAFGGAALVALLLIAIGGSFLVRESTAPIERSISRMRAFMSDAAHELRTPVTVIRTGAEVAVQQPRDAERYIAALDGIASESRRLGTILDDLLVLARADAGERPVQRQPLFLDDLTADAADAARPLAEAAGIAFELDQFDEVEIVGDPDLLRQLVLILLDNAFKYTGRGGTVRLRVGHIDGRPSVIVTDTGIGIAAEDLPRIFERFFRVDRGRSRDAGGEPSVGGAGLGLAIARWIADAHGAEIDVASAVGEGTVVRVRFASDRTAPRGS